MVKYRESRITGGDTPITNIEYPMLNVEGKKKKMTIFLIKSYRRCFYFIIQHLTFEIQYFIVL
jgi:hypothetical protein